MRLCILLCVASCYSAPTTQPRTQTRTVGRTVSLELDRDPPGRLVLDRDGRAWQAQCNGSRMRVRPWEGGDARDRGPCTHRDSGSADTDDYIYAVQPIALSADVFAIYLDRSRELSVTAAAGERRYRIGEGLRDISLAIDGAAVVMVIRQMYPGPDSTVHGTNIGNSLAAIVRIEGDKISVRQLVAYRGTGPESAPKYLAAGKQHLLLVSAGGATRRCDYHGECEAVRPGKPVDIAGALPLPDGGIVLLDFDFSVTRLASDGRDLWTTKLSALALVGATSEHVWVKTRHDDPRGEGLPIVALSLASGKPRGTPAIARTQRRDRLGRFLEISGLAATPDGDVVRGWFGGTLAAGSHELETKIRGAECWWENPHDGDEYDIELDGTCEERYAKAVLTARAAFVAVNPRELRQKR